MLTPDQLAKILPKCRDLRIWVAALEPAWERFGVTTPCRQAAFLAQAGHESAQFGVLRENLSYGIRGLMATWPARFPNEQAAVPFARQPQRLANWVYAGRLGNGPYESGDGYRYRGGGLLQITGRAQYEAAGAALGVPLVDAPQKIEQPAVAALASAWWWNEHGCNELADASEFDRLTEVINGPLKLGLEERKAIWQRAAAVLRC